MATYDNIVTDGLIFHVDAANNIHTTPAPSSATENMINIESGFFAAQAIVEDNVYKFDGADDLIEFTPVNITTEITVDIWFKSTTTTDIQEILSQWRANSYTDSTFTFEFFGGNLYFFVADGSAKSVSSPINTNQWYNAVGVANGSSVEMYIDGVLIGSTPTSSIVPTVLYPLYLGAFRNDNDTIPTLFYNGELASAKIYNKALTAEEVSKNYESQKHRFH